MQQRLSIDRIRCDGYGMCAEILPEMIALDDWGYPILRDAPVPGPVIHCDERYMGGRPPSAAFIPGRMRDY